MFFCTLLFSCQDEIHPVDESTLLTHADVELEWRSSSGSDTIPSGPGETILGAELANPYAKANMEKAFKLLTGKYMDLKITHYYVKLLPSTVDHVLSIAELEEMGDYEFELQPIHYEVIYEGDEGYIDPSVPDDGGFAPEYGAVTYQDYQNGVLNQIPHVILDEMVISNYESRLTFTAFVISGNEKNYEAIDGACHPDCPTWPDCLDDPALTCDLKNGGSLSDIPTLNPNYNGTRSNFPDYILDNALGESGDHATENNCIVIEEITIQDYYACVLQSDCNLILTESTTIQGYCTWECDCPPVHDHGDGNDTGNDYSATCGCDVYTNPRKPGGKILVEDTQIDDEGVRRVKVKSTRSRWGFIWRSTDTDDDGCWRIDKSYGVKNAKFKVVFKDRVSDRLVIRAVRGARVWNAIIKPVKHKWTLRRSNKIWNNLCLTIEHSTDENSRDEQSFVAATNNNALHEYYDDHLDLPTVDRRLRILVQNWRDRTGSAPMFHDSGFSLPDFENLLIALGTAPYTLSSIVWQAARPDVIVPMGRTWPSDRIKRLMYHELAHTSQYTEVGKDWWEEYIQYILDVPNDQPGPYGDGSLPGAGRPEIAEAMAESIDLYMTDLEYGINHSNGGDQQQRRNVNFAEALRFWTDRVRDDNGNLSFRHLEFIPEGLFFDLFDENGVFPATVSIAEHASITDPARGFSFEEQMKALESQPETIGEYRDVLYAQFGQASGTSEPDYNLLFSAYGH